MKIRLFLFQYMTHCSLYNLFGLYLAANVDINVASAVRLLMRNDERQRKCVQ